MRELRYKGIANMLKWTRGVLRIFGWWSLACKLPHKWASHLALFRFIYISLMRYIMHGIACGLLQLAFLVISIYIYLYMAYFYSIYIYIILYLLFGCLYIFFCIIGDCVCCFYALQVEAVVVHPCCSDIYRKLRYVYRECIAWSFGGSACLMIV